MLVTLAVMTIHSQSQLTRLDFCLEGNFYFNSLMIYIYIYLFYIYIG